jgi:hypothetical protein
MIKAGKYYSASCLCSAELQNFISGYKGSPIFAIENAQLQAQEA